ncbi:MAG TPA: MerC domain-containing protein [Cellvibrionaceae bacterium]
MKDSMGMVCSGLCLGHCLLTPLLLALGSAGALGVAMHSEWVHWALMVPIIVLALLSFPGGYRVHRRVRPVLLGIAGALLLVLALFVQEAWEPVLSVLGGGLLISGHWINRRRLRQQCGAAVC